VLVFQTEVARDGTHSLSADLLHLPRRDIWWPSDAVGPTGLVRFLGMEYDEDKVDEIVLALLFLTMFEETPYGARAWKGHDWNVLDRLHAKGYISDPRSKTNRS
jgi:Domain of unknown function (DUF6429)